MSDEKDKRRGVSPTWATWILVFFTAAVVLFCAVVVGYMAYHKVHASPKPCVCECVCDGVEDHLLEGEK